MESSSLIASVEVLAVDRGLDAGHQQVRGVAAGGDPQRPDAVLDVLGAVGVGRDLERLEQEVEAAHLVAALRARQVGSAAASARPTGRRAGWAAPRSARTPERRNSSDAGPEQARGIEVLMDAKCRTSPCGGKTANGQRDEKAAGRRRDSALAGLEAALRLVDHVDAALAPDDRLSRWRPRNDFNELRTFMTVSADRRVWRGS